MKTKIVFLSILMLLFTTSLVYAQEDEVVDVVEDETIVEVVEDETIVAEDLDVSDPALLPDSTFYFFKDWRRGIQSVFTFNKVKKAELYLNFADERLVEAKKLAEETGNEEILAKAIKNYEKAVEKVEEHANKLERDNPDSERFLNKFVDHEVKRLKLVDGLVKKLPEQARERLLNAQENSLERFANIVTRLDDPEKLQKRIDEIGEQQEGSKYKHFKNLEVLSRIEEKLPENAKEAIQKAQESTVKRLHGDLVNMSPEDQDRFKDYLSNVGGNELRHAEIIDRLENEDLPEDLREKLIQSRERVVQRVGERLDEMNEEERERYLRRLEKGEIGELRILNELKENLPEVYRERIEGIKKRAENRFGDRLKDMNEEEKERLFKRIDRVPDARTFGVLEDLEEKLPQERREAIKELRDRALKRLEADFAGAKDESARRRITERLSGDDPRHAEILRKIESQVSPEAQEALRRVLEKTEVRRFERTERFVERERRDLERKDLIERREVNSDEFREKRELNKEEFKERGLERRELESRELDKRELEGRELESRELQRRELEKVTCPAVYNPVCGANGKTYSNECRAKAVDARIVHKGVCRAETGEVDKPTVDVGLPEISPTPSVSNTEAIIRLKERCRLKQGIFVSERTICKLPDGNSVKALVL